MKISELNTKSFLGASGAAENSYVLINYEDETTNEPVTYKATVQELGKTIANKLGLTVKSSIGINTVENSNGTWVSRTAGDIVTQAEKNKIAAAATQSQMTTAIETATSGLASTGDVTNAVNGLASTGYVTNAVSGLASIGYVDAAVENAGGGSEFDPGASVKLEEDGTNNEITTYPVFIGGSNNTFYDASDSGYATPIFTMGRDRVVVFSSGTGIGYYDPGSSDFNKVEIDADFNPKTYVDEDNYDQKLLFYKDSSGTPTIQVYDSDYSRYDTIALAPLQAGYDNDTYDAAYIDDNGHLIKVDTTDPANGAYATYFGAIASEGDITDAIRVGYTDNEYAHKTAGFMLRDSTGNFYRINNSGWIVDASTLASQGYVTSAVSGLASTGYVTAHVGPSMGAIAAAVNNSGTTLNGYIKAIASAKAALAVNGAVNGLASTGAVTAAVSGLASTGYVTSAVANAGGFDPTESITCPVGYYTMNQSFVLSEPKSLYPVMMMLDSDNYLYVKSSDGDGLFELGGLITTTELHNITDLAYISTSSNKPCIRDCYGTFKGFLSET